MSKTETIGRYQIIKLLAKGGMGEILLGYDPLCQRHVAIKRIRSDIKNADPLKRRFLKEAHFTASLTHPGVITIYSISDEEGSPFYTMPYVEGKTLKQIIIDAIKNREEGSIPTLLPIFKVLCQTIAYAHSKGVIHRDIKPENILVGKFGEVILLDWGLAIISGEQETDQNIFIKEESPHLTSPGKIVGTLAYLAPERSQGEPATVLTDIYALGVILYQILTLQLPFKRTTITEFQKKCRTEKFIDPEEAAPYRDVPPRLSAIVKKCLSFDPNARYPNVESLLHELVSHMEGRAEWYEVSTLDIHKKEDWEFQENLFVAKHIAIARSFEGAEWLSIMLSKTSFAENLKLECTVQIQEKGEGIGILLAIPEVGERQDPIDGYCLWLGSDLKPSTQLLRNTATVLSFKELVLEREKKYHLSIEKRDRHIHFKLNGNIEFSYISYLPLVGTHVGILSRDADFTLSPIHVYISSHALQVSCLAIPDSFLASKDYKRALAEYRRIGYSFPGHAEGREALFRAGVTLLEQGRSAPLEEQESFFNLALNQFAALQKTPGAPLEYLGKSLVYQASNDPISEIKCLELALRRFPNHPLITAIKEQILYRLHETAKKSRPSAYRLILTALRNVPELCEAKEFKNLFNSLVQNWEPLAFFEEPTSLASFDTLSDDSTKKRLIREAVIVLSFWLAEPFYLKELLEELDPKEKIDAPFIGNILYALFELGSLDDALTLFHQLEKVERSSSLKDTLTLLRPIVLGIEDNIATGIQAFFALKPPEFGTKEFRTLRFLLDRALWTDSEELIEGAFTKLPKTLPLHYKIELDVYRIEAFFKQEMWNQAGALFSTYPLELLNQETTPLHPLFGCFLYETEGEEMAHLFFSGVTETPFPRSYALLSYEITGKLKTHPSWYEQSFLWERRQLFRSLTFYYHTAQNPEKETFYRLEEKKEYTS